MKYLNRFASKMAIIVSSMLFSVCTVTSIVCSEFGIEIKTEGTFIGRAQQKKLANLLVNKPAALLSDIDFIVQNQLKKRKKELKVQLFEKLGKVKTAQKLLKIRKLLARNIGFIHESFIDADILNDILVKNPYLVRLFIFEEEGAAEEGAYYTKKQFAKAFNNLSKLNFVDLTYDQYLLLKEHYKNIPFFKLLHNVRECIGCGIARVELPFVREYLEKQVVDYVKENHPDKNKQLVITDFASGNLFQIFVVINKLAALGYTNIRLNLIDIAFKSVIDRYLQRLAEEPVPKLVIKAGTFKLSRDDINSLFNVYQTVSGELEMGQKDIDAGLDVINGIISDTQYNNTFAYFSQWFNGTGLNLDLVLYPDAKDYLAESNPTLKSDLLLGVDYFTDLDEIFQKLRKQGLKETGMAFTIDHSYVEDNPEEAEFYFSKGSQKQVEMDHFVWDLKTKELKPIRDLPGTVEYYLSRAQLARLFTEEA